MDCLSNILKHDTLLAKKDIRRNLTHLFILALTYKFVTSLETVQINNKRARVKQAHPVYKTSYHFSGRKNIKWQ